MATKMGLEFIFNLQWRNKPEKGNLMGMYDTPTVTQNFETFKSYLLKNSGVPGDDVQVIMVVSSAYEWIIDSQTSFELALYTFRLKARLAEPIYLKLDRISEKKSPQKIQSCKTETPAEPISNNESSATNEIPSWFSNYMSQFKQEIVEEVTSTVTNALCKDQITPPIQLKKHKSEPVKRSRKHLHTETPVTDKEIIKALKHERKTEIKLDKLEAKSKKIKEKRRFLLDKVVTLPPTCANCYKEENHHDFKKALLMDACQIDAGKKEVISIGGTVHKQEWKVMNSGKLQWTCDTKLCQSWGTKMMPALENVIQCPPLKPGEACILTTEFLVPKTPGRYESFWNFFNKRERFGKWLSCVVIVKPGPEVFLDQDFTPQYFERIPKLDFAGGFNHEPIVRIENTITNKNDEDNDKKEDIIKKENLNEELEKLIISNSIENSDSDNQSDLSSIENDPSWTKVRVNESFLEKPELAHYVKRQGTYGISESDLTINLLKNCNNGQENGEAVIKSDNDDDKNNCSNETDHFTLLKEDDAKTISTVSCNSPIVLTEEYLSTEDLVEIVLKDQKVQLPKSILNPNLSLDSGLEKNENNEATLNLQTLNKELRETNELLNAISPTGQSFEDNFNPSNDSHCATAGSSIADENTSSNSRLFVFSETKSGYEFVYPSKEIQAEMKKENLSTSLNSFLTQPHPNLETSSADKLIAPEPYRNSTVRPTSEESWVYRPVDVPEIYKTEIYHPVPNFQQSMSNVDTFKRRQSRQNSETLVQQQQDEGQRQKEQQQNQLQFQQQQEKAVQQQQQSPVQQQQQSPVQQFLQQQQQSQMEEQSQNSQRQSLNQTNSELSEAHSVSNFPENIVSGAVNVASSAISTARSVLSMITPTRTEPGDWVNGHWRSNEVNSKRSKNLRTLFDMGFWDIELNTTLLGRYNDDMNRVISELLQ